MSEQTFESSSNPMQTESRLRLRRCRRCNKLFAPMTAECSLCQSWDLGWVPSSGLGFIVSSRLVHRSVTRPHAQVVPLTIAIVELDEGPWMYTTIEGNVPPFPDSPVRVRFEPRPRIDRFPVFAICAEVTGSADGMRSASRPVSAANDMGSARRPDPEHRYDVSWVRAALRQCDLMESAESLDSAAKSLLGFAIRWAPFGGATADELLVSFGMTHRRFLQMVDEVLRPLRTDCMQVRGLKRHLQDSLVQAWRTPPAAQSAGDV
ncbi:Zn-ribbon domain-containing OB-fold protein [Nocardia sp. XZ_19_231]|uniref:Zn-ribbon domain-containing OB-fold protein n=1 Tax=Nocardia sp. XZ_19_231 TaxID=2769252 RepID=UPI001E3E2949|nr:OB-fold domain-containing protein [Nocardia sp. XZ_19_231]